jgi:uncharacterized cupredoxin-like copper-binding protein
VSLHQDPPSAADPARHVVTDEEFSQVLARDAEERRREHQQTRALMNGLVIAAALLSALALLVSFFALTRSTGTTTKTVVMPAAGMGTAGSGPASTPATPAALGHTVKASLTEMKIADSPSTVAAGKVTFTVTNNGSSPHEYVVLDTPTRAADLPTTAGGRASEAGNIGETGDLQPGETKTFALTLKPGHYAIICNLPGHYAAGMYTDLTAK